jgi:type VI secretion system secreted protein VgrG
MAAVQGEGGRGRLRGAGAELRTDADGLVHSVQGLLLSTHGRCPDEGPAADARQALKVLRAGAGHEKEPAAPVPDADAVAAGPPRDTVPRAGPRLLLDAAHGFTLAASRHALCAAGTRLELAAGERLGMHAGADLLLLGAAGLRLHVHRMGLRLLAAAGALHLHACDGPLLAAARGGLCLRSAGDLRVRAARGIVLGGGGSFVRLDPGGIDYGSPGPLLQRGAPACLGLR